MRTAGFVLVGGRSSRMGQDKAFLPAPSGPLVQEVAAKVKAAAGSVTLIGDPARYGHLGYECLPDHRPGLGPLAGIEAALLSGRGEANLVVACDMPGLRLAWLQLLLEKAETSDALCTALRCERQALQPLCAVYRTACLASIQFALDEKRLKLFDVVQQLAIQAVDIPGPIFNVNTPDEWASWQKRETNHTGTHVC